MPTAPEIRPRAGRPDRMMLLVFGTGAAIGLQSGLLHVFLWRSWLALATFLGSALGFAAATYVLWRWVFPRLDARSLGGQIALETAVSCVTFAILSFVTTELVVTLLGMPSMFGAPTGAERIVTITPELRQMAVRLYALLPIVPTVLLTLIGYHQYWHRVLSLAQRERELTDLAATAQLTALRAQMNPHFLFNGLNSIAQLIRSDPDKAEACVERLADLFRYVLRRAEKELVPLADELEMAGAYLEIERARFGERLRVETRIDAGSLQHLIPNLILQPLVENAVKHGVSRKRGTGTIRIDAAVHDGCLELVVVDDGVGMPDGAPEAIYERGMGLRTLRDRLARLYGAAHLPDIRSAPGGGTEVRLRLPARPLGVAA